MEIEKLAASRDGLAWEYNVVVTRRQMESIGREERDVATTVCIFVMDIVFRAISFPAKLI